MLRIEDLLFQYPNTDFSLSVDELSIKAGTKTAFIGPSGTGKSAFARHLAERLRAPVRGRCAARLGRVRRGEAACRPGGGGDPAAPVARQPALTLTPRAPESV